MAENETPKENQGQQQGKKQLPKELEPFKWKKGESGNPGGRPKGPSLKEWVKIQFKKMSDEERMDFLQRIDPDMIWRMGEGNPKETHEVKDEEDPFEEMSEEELNYELERIQKELGERKDQATGEAKSDIPHGKDSGIPGNGESSQGSGGVPKTTATESNSSNPSAQKPPENNNDNGGIHDILPDKQS